MQGIWSVTGIGKSVEFSKNLVANGIVKDDSLLFPLVVYLCKSNKVADAYNLFKDFKNHGLSPTLGTQFSSLAFMLLKEMRKIGCTPDVCTYNLLLDALAKAGKAD
ncbi:hypothetical protein EJ110_NYTH13289 [Nymphaea thermarum]|nr:hypothetical protein EJ110_NYTH13289 [Nymphaea thermarum]